ncbi:hypothetical protein O3G_MSEX014970, partial [Manduca sexta]
MGLQGTVPEALSETRHQHDVYHEFPGRGERLPPTRHHTGQLHQPGDGVEEIRNADHLQKQ